MLQIINQTTITIFSRILSVAYVAIIMQGFEYRIFILMSIFIFSNLFLYLIQKCISNENLKNAMEIQILLINIAIIYILWEEQHYKISVIYMFESIILKLIKEEDIQHIYIPTLYIVSLEGYFIKLLAEDQLNHIPLIIILILLILVKMVLILLRHHYSNKSFNQLPISRGQNSSFQSRSPKPINESLIQSPIVDNTILKIFKELYEQEKIMILNFDYQLQYCNFDIQKILKEKQMDESELFTQFLKQQCKFSHTKKIMSVRESLEQVITKIRKFSYTKLKLNEHDVNQYTIVYFYLEEIKNIILHITKIKRSSKIQKRIAQNFLIDITKSLSHNLGTNLNAIKTYSIYALEDQQISSYVKDKYIKPISINSQQLNLFISNIRDLSLIKLDQFDLKLEYFNIKDEIEFIQSLFQDAIERRRIKIINPIIDGQIMNDKNRFRQVYFQLFQNSVKFTQAGMIKTEIKLITKLTQQYYYISVTDTGLGMSNAELTVLQNIISSGQFQRVSKHSVGSGLGICISSLIAKNLSGNQESLICESLSPGTRIAMILKGYNPEVFVKQNSEKSDSSYIKVFDKERSYIEGMISLTSKQPDKKMSYVEVNTNHMISINESNDQSLYIPEQSDLQVQCLPSFRIQFLTKSQDNFTSIIQSKCCSKVLIADDEVFNIFTLEIILKKYTTIIDTSFNGQEAINKIKYKLYHPCEKCNSNFYSLILLDINMPVLDGLQTAKQIKAMINQKIIPKTWIIANSGFCDLQTKLAALTAGFDHYLTKPIDQQAIEHLLLRVLEVSINQ